MNEQQAFLNNVELTQNEVASIVGFHSTPAYEAVMKLIHGEVIKAETECFQAFKEGKDKFHDKGAIAVAMRTLMERVETAIARHTEDHLGAQHVKQIEEARHKLTQNPTFESIAEGLSNGTITSALL